MANVSTKIADALTKHGIDLLRVDASIRREIVARLNGLERELIRLLRKVDPMAPTNVKYQDARLVQLMGVSKSVFDQVYKDIQKSVHDSLTTIAEAESHKLITTINRAVQVQLVAKVLDPQTAKVLASRNVLIQGAPSADWWAKQKKDRMFAFERSVREGMLAGEGIDEIARRVRGTRANKYKDGIMETTRRQAQTLVRTSVQTVANESRFRTLKENNNVVKGYQWLATLDSRTTILCMTLDGQSWDLEGNPINGSTAGFQRPPPAHFNCRSTLIPVLKSWADLVDEKKGGKRVADKLRKIKKPASVRASMDGGVSDKLDYSEWLKRKDAKNPEFARGILGPGRYDLWKKGKLSFSDLIDQSWNPLTVEQLRNKIIK